VHTIIVNKIRVAFEEVADCLQISHSSTHKIMHNRINIRTVFARWVPNKTHSSSHIQTLGYLPAPSQSLPLSLGRKYGSTTMIQRANTKEMSATTSRKKKTQNTTQSKRSNVVFLGFIWANTGTLPCEQKASEQRSLFRDTV